jgi:hypothetical protein
LRSKWINIKLDFSKELETQLEYLHTITKQPIKEFLLQHSYLVKFNQKNRTSQELNQREQAQQTRIYKLRGRAFNRIIQELSRYYQTVINGDYRFDGMPEIKHGISG